MELHGNFSLYMKDEMKILKLLFVGLGLLLVTTSCSDNSTGMDDDDEEPKDNTEIFDGPTYSDNYTSISSWSNRSQWNLANVYDPTVVKDGDYYQTMQHSYEVTFHEDHTLGGALEGSWSYDEATETLTVNDTELVVDNAWDWEASPRQTTITYAGLTPSGRSVWGKKIVD